MASRKEDATDTNGGKVFMNEKFKDARQEIVKNVYESLKKGTPIWKQPWFSAMRAQRSMSTGKKYKGMNALILSIAAYMEGYTDSRWATFSYITENGGFKLVTKISTKVKNGKKVKRRWHKSLAKGKGVHVFYYHFVDEENEDTGKTERKLKWIKSDVVFNVSLANIPPEKLGASAVNVFDSDEAGEKMLGVCPVPIYYDEESSYYSITGDAIHLPPRERFYGTEQFYGTVFHEMAHSTGAESRLNRKIRNGFGTPEYAREELVAELGSVFLSSMLGMQPSGDERKNNVAYLGNWLEAIQKDNRDKEFFDAVSDAEKASDFLYALYEEAGHGTEPLQYHVTKYGTVSRSYGLCLLPIHDYIA